MSSPFRNLFISIKEAIGAVVSRDDRGDQRDVELINEVRSKLQQPNASLNDEVAIDAIFINFFAHVTIPLKFLANSTRADLNSFGQTLIIASTTLLTS